MVQNLDSLLRIPANRKIIQEEELDPGVVLQLLGVFLKVTLLREYEQLIHQIRIIQK